jgi:GTP cyclohydrolase I
LTLKTARPHDLTLTGEHLLEAIGEDVEREGLQRTPHRFAKAWRELTAGYELTAHDAVGEGVFAAEGNGIVSVRNVEFYSMCEHHLLPFWGKASIAYIPNAKIIGLSKIPRLVDVFSRRLQVQERITRQIADALVDVLTPRAVAVRVQASHLCMMMRGVEKQQSDTLTEYSWGVDALSEREAARLWNAL